MKHTECEDCKLRNGDCGHHFKSDGVTNYDIASLSACDQYGNCTFFKCKAESKGDLISRKALKKAIEEQRKPKAYSEADERQNIIIDCILYIIDNAPTVELQMGRMTNGVIIPIERPQGKWIFDSEFTEFGNPYGTYKCNKCGGHSTNKYPFCFWCGADMREEADNV